MIFRSNAGLVAIILLELILAAGLTRFAIDLPPAPSATDDKPLADSKGLTDDYILLVATTYARDRDIALARERLALFRDDDVATRVGQLAQAYGAQNKLQANELARLAIALGSDDPTLSTMALGSTATPNGSLVALNAPSPLPAAPIAASFTPVRIDTLTRIPSTATRKPTATSTRTHTPTATATRIVTPSPSVPATLAPITPTNTVAPSATPTQVPISSGSVGTTWEPDRSQWPPGTGFQSANVAAGQPYWHLVTALYCDYTEQRYDCVSRAGGPAGWGTYVMLIDGQGNRTEAPLLFNGAAAGQEQKAASDMCNCNYSFSDSGVAIQIGGSSSDSISGLDPLYSVKFGLSHYHVRYFLTFQLSIK